jgi:hypothetical protein
MSRLSVIALILALFLVQDAYSQIIINRQVYESARGKTVVNTSFYMEENLPIEALNTIIAQSGANKSFNFSGITFPSAPDMVTRSRTNNVGESHPFQDEASLAAANYATRIQFAGVPDTVSWSFLKLEDSKVTVLGSGTLIESNGEKEYFDIIGQFGEFFEPLPHTFGSEWVEETEISVEGFKIVTKIFTYVDAWGTLTIPGGRSGNAIRLRSETSTKIEIPGFPMPDEPQRITSYTYITLSGISATIDVEFDPETEKYIPVAVQYSKDGGEFTSSIGRDRVELPEGFTLSQNYPNPFNPTTTIDFSLPFTADATIKVYDMTGRVVSSINMPGTSAGIHSVQFDASRLSSGVYMYRLEAGGFTTAKMFTLVK